MTSDQTPDPGEDSPETVYKPGNPGGNWTPEEIDATRHGPWNFLGTMHFKYLLACNLQPLAGLCLPKSFECDLLQYRYSHISN